jgi:prophage tail gpP-like protein
VARVAGISTTFDFVYYKYFVCSTTGTGELVIYREGVLGSLLGKFPNKAKAGIALINGGRAGNILSSNFKTSVLERFQVIEIFSQNNNTSHSVKNANPIGSAVDEQIKIPNRFRVGKNIPTQSTTLADIAKWNVNVRRAKGRMYNCTVQGISFSPQNRDFWKINTYVEVLDEKKGVNGEFLIESVTFSQSPENGTITQLQLVNKGSYTLDIKQAIQKLQRNNFGNQFSS